MENPADFGSKYWFVGEERGRVVGVDFNDVRVKVVETAVKIKRVDAVKYSIREYVISCSRHILWFQRGWVHVLEDGRSKCSESGNLQSRMGG